MANRSPESPSRTVAIFDFDGTLTHGDSLLPFVRFAVGLPRLLLGLLLLAPTLAAYALGVVPNWKAKQAMLRRFVGGMNAEELNELGRTFARDRLPKLLRPEAIGKLRWHQKQGHEVGVASASIEAYLIPWAHKMGLDHVVATRLEVVEGRVTGLFAGRNCYGSEKVRRLREALGDVNQLCLHAYGDSRGDRELLEVANHAYFRRFSDARREPKVPASGRYWNGAIWFTVVAIVLYAAAVWWTGADELVATVARVSPWVFSASLGIALVGYGLRFLRWDWYLHHMGHAIPVISSARVYFASLALSLSPGRAGESVKSLLLKRRYSVPFTHTIAGLLCERFTDLLAVLLVMSLGILPALNATWAIFGVVATQIGVTLVLWRADLMKRWILRPIRRWRKLDRILNALESLIDRASTLLSPGVLAGGVLLAILSWVCEGIALYWIFQSLGVGSIDLLQATMIIAASDFVGAISFLPGGIGGAEVTLIALSMTYGADQAEAVAATFLIRFVTLWFGVCLGVVAMLWEQRVRIPQP